MERLSNNKRKMLELLYEAAPDDLYGLEIGQNAGIPSGSLYPALRALRKDGLVIDEWRAPDDDPDGRPLRYYRLSPDGVALAKAVVDGKADGAAWKKFLPATMRWTLR